MTCTDTLTRAGETYHRVSAEPGFIVSGQLAGTWLWQLSTADRGEVGALAARVAGEAMEGASLRVEDDAWRTRGGRRLSRSVYRLRGGIWRHFSGARILALEG